jgi:regulator of protease activity HflC (stomatin/prohibitin superfamily)
VALILGLLTYLAIRLLSRGFYTVQQNERAVKTRFGRAERLGDATTKDSPISQLLTDEEKDRYCYPQIKVIPPGGPYFRWPWETVIKVEVATQTSNIARDPENPSANNKGTVLEAVTKDQLNTGMTGQIRWTASEQNLYPAVFAIKSPLTHVIGYFVSVLREKIANFEGPRKEGDVDDDVSINALRKNLSRLNDEMVAECQCSVARYGIRLDASLITSIDPPNEVEEALAAINTAHNEVSSDVSRAKAAADQRITQSMSEVQVQTLNAQAEVAPIRSLATELAAIKTKGGLGALQAYVQNVRFKLFAKSDRTILEVK